MIGNNTEKRSEISPGDALRRTVVYCGGTIVLVYMLIMAYSYGYSTSATSSVSVESWANEFPKACATLGATKNFTVGDKHRKIGDIHKHTFAFPHPLEHNHICVPSKSGNKNWGSLMFKLRFGRVPRDQQEVDAREHAMQSKTFDEKLDHIWLLHRNPYVRILSTYIEKVLCVDAERCSRHRYQGGFSLFRDKGNITFDQFLNVLKDYTTNGQNITHINPLQRGEALCYLDKHLCIQAAGLFKLRDNSVRALKLEDQGSWYRQFLSCMNIDPDLVVGDDWTSLNGMPCFYTPTGNCDDALKEDDTAELFTDHLHGKGSVDRMGSFYTANAAELATYLYEYDLKMLDYPVWDGVTPFTL